MTKYNNEVTCGTDMQEPRIIGRVLCYGEDDVLVRNGYFWNGKEQEYYEVRHPVSATDDELRLAIEQPPCFWNCDTQQWELCSQEKSENDLDGFDYRSKNPFKINPRSPRDIVRFELTSRIKMQDKMRQTLINKGHKPCRYKACNGRAHGAFGEKCPISAARGSSGGSKTGASKARKGNQNGRAKAPRKCCGTLHSKPHAITCSKAKISLRKDSAKLTIRKARKEAVTPKKVEISWAGFAVPTSLFAGMCRHITGTCGGCKAEMSATKATKIHRADVTANKTDARLICEVCV